MRYYFKDIRGFAYDEINACMAASSAGAIWWIWKPAWSAYSACAPAPISNPSPPPSSASRTSWRRQRHRLHRLPSGVDEALLEEGPEAELYQEFRRIAGQPIENVISRLRPKVDLFFDKVLVNAPDPAVRQNRLTLLQTLLAEFSTIADFSEIVTNS